MKFFQWNQNMYLMQRIVVEVVVVYLERVLAGILLVTVSWFDDISLYFTTSSFSEMDNKYTYQKQLYVIANQLIV